MKFEQGKPSLDDLFAMARQQDPILSKDEVESIISKPVITKPGIGKQFGNIVTNHFKTIIMITIASIIITGALWLNNFSEIKPETIQNSGTENTKHSVATTEKSSQESSTVTAKPQLRQSRSSVAKDTVLSQPSSIISDSQVISSPNYQPIDGDQLILELTKEELKQFGFFYYDSVVWQITLNKKGDLHRLMIINQNTKLKKADINEVSLCNVQPLYESDFILTRFKKRSNHAFWQIQMPSVENNVHCVKRDDHSGLSKIIFGLIDSVYSSKKSKSLFISMDGDFGTTNLFNNNFPEYIEDDTLVAIKLILGETQKILWYPANDNFFELLPARYRDTYRGKYKEIRQIKTSYPNVDIVQYNSFCNSRNLIESMNFIQLSLNDLKRLGFKMDFERYKMNYDDGKTVLDWSQIFISFGKKGNKNLSTDSGIKLNYVSDKNGFCWKNNYNEYNLENIAELVPVLLNKDSLKLFPIDKDKILWFTPNEAFFDSLPSAIGNELRNEYNIVKALNSPLLTASQKAELPVTCKYFEECRSNLTELENIELFPNPARDKVNLKFKVTEPTNITVFLFDIMGRPVKQLNPSSFYNIGNQLVPISLANVPNGIFLLHIKNTTGNYKTIRLIKN